MHLSQTSFPGYPQLTANSSFCTGLKDADATWTPVSLTHTHWVYQQVQRTLPEPKALIFHSPPHPARTSSKWRSSYSSPSKVNSQHAVPVQISSVSQSCPTLCDPMHRRTPGLPVHPHLPEFTHTPGHRVCDAIQGRPLLLLPPVSPSIRVFSNESTLCMRWPKYWSFIQL